jgi:U3 small nucleolar RNA-associated protein 20
LALVEKVHARQRALLAGGGAENDALWAAAAGPALLTHAHAWVRAAAARLLGAYCAAGTTPTDPGFAAPPLLAGRGLRAAARATVAALAAGGQDEAAEAQCVKNLVCLAAAAMHRAAEEAARHAAPAAADAGADGDESASDDDDGSDADAEEEGDGGDGRFCEWLLRRVSGLGSPGQPEALRLAVLRWAAGCASRAGGALAGAHAASLLRPAYQAAEGAAENTGEAVRALAAEAVEVLRAVMPPGVFASAYAAQRERAAARRADRRAQRAVEAVADPAAAARRRAARAAKKRTAGAAKAQERRMHRERGTLPADVEARRAAKKARTGGRD